MEGYLWKRGHKMPLNMHRRYCVLKGTMLAYYTTEEECLRKMTPRKVLEVVDVREWDGYTSLRHYKNGLEVDCLGGKRYQFHGDSSEDREHWLEALRHALDEPNRIVQDEIEEAQRHLQDEQEHARQALQLAAEAVQAAQKCSEDAKAYDKQIKDARMEEIKLEEQLQYTRILCEESKKKLQETKHSLDVSRQRAHDATMASLAAHKNDEDHGLGSPTMESVVDRVARLSAKLEVDTAQYATHSKEVASLEAKIQDLSRQQEALLEKARLCSEEGKQLREAAATNLQQAHSAKQMSMVRVASWTSASSHLDPLAEGYLLCKHPIKPSMHRRYYVLYGNTLCWYKDADAYTASIHTPSGVVHVAAVGDWDGKVGRSKTFPHPFTIITIEGKTLCCSAPMRQSALTWNSALHIGLTMPPLSPHRALAAKSRRDSFDLQASMGSYTAPRRASLVDSDRTATSRQVIKDGKDGDDLPEQSIIVVEGYLVKKSALVPVMTKKYCVLKGLRLYVYDTHHAYEEKEADHEEITVCGVAEWDGHGALLHYQHGFQIQTVNHQEIFCSAAHATEKEKWIRGIHEAILRHRDDLLSPTRKQDALVDQARDLLLKDAISSCSSSGGDIGDENDYDAAVKVFRETLHAYYLEHNPAKIQDLPMILASHEGRERVLLEHLDRIFSTTLAQDSSMQSLLERLTPKNRSARRDSAGIRSGMVEFVKMEGYLVWHGVSARKKWFSVLSVDKLVRYNSRAHHETEAHNPLQAIVIHNVHEVGASGPDSTQFVVAYATDEKPNEHLKMALEAATADEKRQWEAKIRSGLGFKHAHSLSPHSPSKPKHTRDLQPLRLKLIEFYKEHNPRRVGEVDTLLSYFTGKEQQLLVKLDSAYGTQIASDPAFVALLSHERATSPKRIDLHYESYLSVKHPMLGSNFRKCYCVIDGETWSCFDSSKDAHAEDAGDDDKRSTAPLLMDAITNMTFLNAKLMSMNVFSIETENNGAVLLRADADTLFHDWTRIIRKALDEQRAKQELMAANEQPDDSALGPLRQQLVSFYRVHNPDKLGEVGVLLHAYQGRELELLKEIDRIYHSHLATDSEVVALLPPQTAPADDPAEPTSADPKTQVLMEGYLVKRGHLMPSMRKRYCVLIKNTLSYYSTHEDSRNSDIKPHGEFKVDVVSDWNGKTSTHVYEHGMELETVDGKTFFCAAYSEEEKHAWVHAFKHGIAIARSEEPDPPDVAADVEETDAQRQARLERLAHLKEALVRFYQVHNPTKVADLDLLMRVYAGREFALLEAIDKVYGSALAHDSALVAFLPPSDVHSQALRALQYDGSLRRSADSNFKRTQEVYVALDGLVINFYASREGYKSGSSLASDHAVTVLAVKNVETETADHVPVYRFGIETTEHTWLYFQAPNALEKKHWLQVLHASLDTVLAENLLEEEKEQLAVARHPSIAKASVTIKGLLFVRLDFQQAGDQTKKTVPMEERYFALQNGTELIIFNDVHDTVVATFTVLSTRSWDPSLSCHVSGHECHFPFQILTQEQVTLSCNAATDVERIRWIKKIRIAAENANALELLREQKEEADREGKHAEGGVAGDPEDIVVGAHEHIAAEADDDRFMGFLYYKLGSGTFMNIAKEAYIVLDTQAVMNMYADQTAFMKGDDPFHTATVTEVLLQTEALPASPSKRSLLSPRLADTSQSLAFQVETSDAKTPIVHFFPSSHSERTAWIEAFSRSIDMVRGQQIIDDEVTVLAIAQTHPPPEATVDDEKAVEMEFIVPHASMESTLHVWHSKFIGSSLADGGEEFAVLVGCNLRCFPSRDVAGRDAAVPTREVVVEDVADWAPPSMRETDVESTGLRLRVLKMGASSLREDLLITCPSIAVKEKWIHVIKHELDFALAAKYLDDEAKEFARLAALHITSAAATDPDGVPVGERAIEGYVRVRHHHIGAIWRERFLVLEGTSLYVYADGSDASADNSKKKTVEKHELLSIEKWRPPPASHGLVHHHHQPRFGFRVENEDGGWLECSVATEQEQLQWFDVVDKAVNSVASHLSSKVTSRDPSLPFVHGAAMEGYLKIREKKRFAVLWKTRYCVLMGTQWFLYDNQNDALAMAEHQDSVLPNAVYEVLHVETWKGTGSATIIGEDELESHALTLMVASGNNELFDCKAHSSLERKRWLNAIQDELDKVTKEKEQFMSALQQRQEKDSIQQAFKLKWQDLRSENEREAEKMREALDGMGDNNSENMSSDDDVEDRYQVQDAQPTTAYLDMNPETSPLRPKGNLTAYPFDDKPVTAENETQDNPYSIWRCFCSCFNRPKVSVAPLEMPGYDAASKYYKLEYYMPDQTRQPADW
ncbi:TPA: hypothetical protein N0F65_006666 [Lagenidium giganteum]|uniref:PH domain-containing protein n=1 Tax=Lagenidium giganteum TaxID=4803 RepID=A0AAV2Z3J0_9STRA|nr:TPA: hypothetical protein N0F65_006666 [Lagenidium giganteum]